ncbi:MAG: CAP domain-containing protein, partial [Hydrogenovibrio sp.]|nr:CAP domain-containing protein [Hydrogenovibrio sp.]
MRVVRGLSFVLLLTLVLFGVYQLFNFVLTPPKSLSVSVINNAAKTDQAPLNPLTAQQAQQQAMAALEYINQIRAGLKLTPLTNHPRLNQAAENHARYCVHNDLQ